MDPPHHIHIKSQMFYLEIRPKWPNMPNSKVIWALPWDLWPFFLYNCTFFSETNANNYFINHGYLLGQCKKKSGQIDLTCPGFRPKIHLKQWKDWKTFSYAFLLWNCYVRFYSPVWVYLWIEQSKFQAKMTLYGQTNMFFILENHVCRHEEFDNMVSF